MLGLFAALQGHPRPAPCPKDGLCVGEQVGAAVWSIFGPAFAGAFAGLAAGLLVCCCCGGCERCPPRLWPHHRGTRQAAGSTPATRAAAGPARPTSHRATASGTTRRTRAVSCADCAA